MGQPPDDPVPVRDAGERDADPAASDGVGRVEQPRQRDPVGGGHLGRLRDQLAAGAPAPKTNAATRPRAGPPTLVGEPADRRPAARARPPRSVSRAAVSARSASPGSRLPPGSAICPDQRSPGALSALDERHVEPAIAGREHDGDARPATGGPGSSGARARRAARERRPRRRSSVERRAACRSHRQAAQVVRCPRAVVDSSTSRASRRTASSRADRVRPRAPPAGRRSRVRRGAAPARGAAGSAAACGPRAGRAPVGARRSRSGGASGRARRPGCPRRGRRRPARPRRCPRPPRAVRHRRRPGAIPDGPAGRDVVDGQLDAAGRGASSTSAASGAVGVPRPRVVPVDQRSAVRSRQVEAGQGRVVARPCRSRRGTPSGARRARRATTCPTRTARRGGRCASAPCRCGRVVGAGEGAHGR